MREGTTQVTTNFFHKLVTQIDEDFTFFVRLPLLLWIAQRTVEFAQNTKSLVILHLNISIMARMIRNTQVEERYGVLFIWNITFH